MNESANDLMQLLKDGEQMQASDLLLVPGSPPCIYVQGHMQRMEASALSADAIRRLVTPFLTETQSEELKRYRDVDLSVNLPGAGRVRANLHFQRCSLAGAFRYIPATIPRLEDLNLPDIFHEFAHLRQGLFLVTGASGHGKSTTLAAMINKINQTRSKHIITLEDPIEFLFRNEKSLIEQREIGTDSPSFASALRHILRQKPEVVLVGEMRDQETMSTAMTAAETGHLVLATMHTFSAVNALERIVDSFEGRQQQQIRIQLSHTLQAAVSQILFRDCMTGGLIPACEVLVATPAVQRAIRDNETHLIGGMIETGSKYSMQTLNQTVVQLVAEGRISREDSMSGLLGHVADERLRSMPASTRNAPIPPPAKNRPEPARKRN